MTGTRAFSALLSNSQKYLRSTRLPNNRTQGKESPQTTYSGLSAIKSARSIQPLPRHPELQAVVCIRNKLICMRTESSCSSLGTFRCRTASEFYCGSVDQSSHEDLKTLNPATTALLAGRYSPLWSGGLAGFDVRFSLLTEQLLVKVGKVKWLQIEAIPLLSPHRCHAETVLAPSSLCV
ncbi:hypothetical protein B0T09DRAFT_354176 [Sordaria sp. MPI-SDFR-AT-0083]|nr:hypothetical protein B0T09DRAFT_354176 [Sordaria sp. MPI-SDFR-AT-0083]